MKHEIIEIPFGAFDSELGGFEYTIPEGFSAEIKDGKVIVRKAEREDKKIRKANEAPKSKFIYPDKLYARCKDNKTLDISYAPQNMEAVEYTRTDAFIEKACEYLRNTKRCVVECIGENVYKPLLSEEEIMKFCKSMKGE